MCVCVCVWYVSVCVWARVCVCVSVYADCASLSLASAILHACAVCVRVCGRVCACVCVDRAPPIGFRRQKIQLMDAHTSHKSSRDRVVMGFRIVFSATFCLASSHLRANVFFAQAKDIEVLLRTWSRFLRHLRSDLTRSLLKERVRCDLKRLKNGFWRRRRSFRRENFSLGDKCKLFIHRHLI